MDKNGIKNTGHYRWNSFAQISAHMTVKVKGALLCNKQNDFPYTDCVCKTSSDVSRGKVNTHFPHSSKADTLWLWQMTPLLSLALFFGIILDWVQ